MTLTEKIVSLLRPDTSADARVTVEINAKFPESAPDHIRRGVTENATQLGFNPSS